MHGIGINLGNARSNRIQVHPPGKGRRHGQPRGHRIRHQSRRKGCRGAVFGHITRFQQRHSHPRHPGRAQAINLFRPQHQAFAKPRRPAAIGPRHHRMCQNGALGLIQWHLTKAHQPLLRRWVICARMDTAISAGVLAPISRPTGAWIRAICAAVRPAACNRSTRLAWVREDPRQPR